jgi:DME family drug/metabolite transporter
LQSRWLAVIPGFVLNALAGVMWAVDGALRVPLLDADLRPSGTEPITPSAIVFVEHTLLVVATLPFLRGAMTVLRGFSAGDWLSLILIGAGASAVATALFTESFAYGQINTTLLLQKLQPLIVLFAAWLLLAEKPLGRYWLFFIPAVGGAWFMTFADPFDVSVDEAAPAMLALGAAALWGLGTVLGRRLIPKVEFKQLTALRFLIGLPAMAIVLTVLGEWGSLGDIRGSDFIGTAEVPSGATVPAGLILVAGIPGLLALLSYYRGLRTTPAISATLAELAFPLTAVVVNAILELNFVPPDNSQWVGAGVLAIAITAMGIVAARSDGRAHGVEYTPIEAAPEPVG